MFRVDECTGASTLLRFSNDMQGQRSLARAFRAVNFYDASSRETANSERKIQSQRASRNYVNLLAIGPRAHPHDRTFTKGPFNLGHGSIECLRFFHSADFRYLV